MLIYCFNWFQGVGHLDWQVCVGGIIGDILASSPLKELEKCSHHQPSHQPLHQRDYTHPLAPLNNVLMVNLLEGKSHHVPDYRTGTRRGNTSNNPMEMKLTGPNWRVEMGKHSSGNGYLATWQFLWRATWMQFYRINEYHSICTDLDCKQNPDY